MTYAQPLYPFFVVLTLIALLRHWRRCAGPKPWLLTVALALQLLFTLPAVSGLGSWTLERGYPLTPFPSGDAETIVVLSGAAYGPRTERPTVLLASDTYIRCQHAAWLYKNWKQLPVLVCGGEFASTPGAPTLAEAMRDALEKEGVPSEMIWCENRSKSTFENSLYGAEILRENGIERIALVTEAFHMPRAERCFRKQGIDVVPAPCGFRTGYSWLEWGSFLPTSTPIRRNEQTFHEWIALLWYWLQGRS